MSQVRIERVPISSTQTPSVQHISSTQWLRLFSIHDPSVQHQKPLSWTRPSVQHPLGSTHPSVPHPPRSTHKNRHYVELNGLRCWTEGFLVFNWGVRWTEGFLVLYWGIFGPEREWPFCVELLSWTEGVWNREAHGSNSYQVRYWLIISYNGYLLITGFMIKQTIKINFDSTPYFLVNIDLFLKTSQTSQTVKHE